jgi:hypothetical protein
MAVTVAQWHLVPINANHIKLGGKGAADTKNTADAATPL